MQQLPEEDKHTYSREYWRDQLAVFYGGREAELMVFNEVNTGASSDIKRATEIARKMVCQWGMSETLGPIAYSDQEEHVFLGREIGKTREHSEATQQIIDQEVSALLDEARKRAREALEKNRKFLEDMALAVLERETLDGKEIDLILEGKTLPPVKIEGKVERPSENGVSITV
jgi:cell division protease FtsH